MSVNTDYVFNKDEWLFWGAGFGGLVELFHSLKTQFSDQKEIKVKQLKSPAWTDEPNAVNKNQQTLQRFRTSAGVPWSPEYPALHHSWTGTPPGSPSLQHGHSNVALDSKYGPGFLFSQLINWTNSATHWPVFTPHSQGKEGWEMADLSPRGGLQSNDLYMNWADWLKIRNHKCFLADPTKDASRRRPFKATPAQWSLVHSISPQEMNYNPIHSLQIPHRTF